MASPFTHAFFAFAAGKVAIPRKMLMRFWVLTAVCGIIPDIDLLWRRLITNPQGIWNHRGITHSLLAAVLFGLLAACICWMWKQRPDIARDDQSLAIHISRPKRQARAFLLLWMFFALATASHAILDMLSSGYRGVMLLAPFSDQRYSFAWQPIWSMPHWLGQMFPSLARHGGQRMSIAFAAISEVVVVWVPMSMLLIGSWIARATRRKAPVTVVGK